MLDYTKVAFSKTLEDLKRIAFWFTVVMQIMMIGLPLYSIAVGNGIVWLNVILSAVSLLFLVFFVFQERDERCSKTPCKITKRIQKILKYINKMYNISIAVYGVYVAAEHTTLVSLVYVGFMVIGLLLGIILDLVISFCCKRAELIMTALEADFEVVTKPLGKVQGVVDWVRGKEREEEAPPTASEVRARAYLDDKVAVYRADKRRKKSEDRADMASAWNKRIKSIFKRNKNEAPEDVITESEEVRR